MLKETMGMNLSNYVSLNIDEIVQSRSPQGRPLTNFKAVYR